VLALVFSALLTIYIIIPEAIFRFFFGFHISVRSFVLTRTETAFRAALVAFLPFWVAMMLAWYAPIANCWPFPVHENTIQQRRIDYKVVASGLYSDAEFAKLGESFWASFTRCSRRQARLAFWYFLLVALEAWFTGRFAAGYGRIEKKKIYRWLRDRFLAPYISHWPPLLETASVQADILCADGTLYQGIVAEYFLKNDGELSGIILHGPPRRFNRELYVKHKAEGKNPQKEVYWSEIPSQHLYFFAKKIVNMNLNYIAQIKAIPSIEAISNYIARELGQWRKLRISIQVHKPHSESGTDEKDGGSKS
jgi:hypothetical protein